MLFHSKEVIDEGQASCMEAAVKPLYFALPSQTLQTGNLPRHLPPHPIYASGMHFLTGHAFTGEFLSRFRVQSDDMRGTPANLTPYTVSWAACLLHAETRR
jgi:hypothetical protein